MKLLGWVGAWGGKAGSAVYTADRSLSQISCSLLPATGTVIIIEDHPLMQEAVSSPSFQVRTRAQRGEGLAYSCAAGERGMGESKAWGRPEPFASAKGYGVTVPRPPGGMCQDLADTQDSGTRKKGQRCAPGERLGDPSLFLLLGPTSNPTC